MSKTYIYRSTYRIPFEKWKYTLGDKPREMFETLWFAGQFSKLLRSAYFQIMRIGDGKYTLTVQKVQDMWCLKYVINEHYANKADYYTK